MTRFFEAIYQGDRVIGMDEPSEFKTLKLYKTTIQQLLDSGECLADSDKVRHYLDNTTQAITISKICIQDVILMPPLFPASPGDAFVSGFMQTHNIKMDKSNSDNLKVPNWFFKGFTSSLKVSGSRLIVPKNPVALCEEAEVVLIYQADDFGKPQYRGYSFGNDLTDIGCFKRNPGHLAYAKLCDAAISYWFHTSPPPQKVNGEVTIKRDGKLVWQGIFNTGLLALGYDLSDMMNHLFSFPALCSPGRTYYVYIGADRSSYHSGFNVEDNDQVIINFLSHNVVIDNQIQFGYTAV